MTDYEQYLKQAQVENTANVNQMTAAFEFEYFEFDYVAPSALRSILFNEVPEVWYSNSLNKCTNWQIRGLSFWLGAASEDK